MHSVPCAPVPDVQSLPRVPAPGPLAPQMRACRVRLRGQPAGCQLRRVHRACPVACARCRGLKQRPLRPHRVLHSSQGSPYIRDRYTGTGLVDSAAKCSVAGCSLYKILCKLNYIFLDSFQCVKLADGVQRKIQVKLANNVSVILDEMIVPTDFVIFPNAVNNDTLLGVDFIRNAKIVLDVSNNSWVCLSRDSKCMWCVVADTLSRPPCSGEVKEFCSICSVEVDIPCWEASKLREDQLADPEISKIISGSEGHDNLELNRWTERGYHFSMATPAQERAVRVGDLARRGSVVSEFQLSLAHVRLRTGHTEHNRPTYYNSYYFYNT
ncbi:hypothetical protein ACJJTC_019047 [Scirpophaga incertulas]